MTTPAEDREIERQRREQAFVDAGGEREFTPRFGDTIRGIWASEKNPQRDGLYLRTVRRTGRVVNPGTFYEMTDGKGKFWMYWARDTVRIARAALSAATQIQQPDSDHLTCASGACLDTPATPAAQWRANGEPDPHGDRYNCERAALVMGDLSDDELANGAFLNYDRFDIKALVAQTPGYYPPIAWMTAVKDRIRWLSRKLEEASTGADTARHGSNDPESASAPAVAPAVLTDATCWIPVSDKGRVDFEAVVWNDEDCHELIAGWTWKRANLVLAASAAQPEIVGQKQPQSNADQTFDFHAHLHRQREWSEKTFGPGPRTAGVIDHIRKELREIEAEPQDLSEWIDVAILALDGAWRAGYTPDEIIGGLVGKQTKNEGRSWPDWRTAPQDRAIEHNREVQPRTGADNGSHGTDGIESASPVAAQEHPSPRYRVEFDGFIGTQIGNYQRLDGEEGVVLQQDGTNIVLAMGRNRADGMDGRAGAEHDGRLRLRAGKALNK